MTKKTTISLFPTLPKSTNLSVIILISANQLFNLFTFNMLSSDHLFIYLLFKKYNWNNFILNYYLLLLLFILIIQEAFISFHIFVISLSSPLLSSLLKSEKLENNNKEITTTQQETI